MGQRQQVSGLTARRLENLCQPAQIERTLHLLFTLNHWAKAREHLFFSDRQGLYAAKTAIIRQAYMVGAIVAHAYIDGSKNFGRDLAIDMASDMAAEAVLLQLEEQAQSAKMDTYSRIAERFYVNMTGKGRFTLADVQALDRDRIQEYIRVQLDKLERAARAARQPIPARQLTELCIAPSDLLDIHDRRFYELGNWDSWDELDASDLRKLDPEGLSLIAFHHTSQVSHYVFHLPLRLAETFLPVGQLLELKSTPLFSRESGEYYGRPITETESLQQSIKEILNELEVDITAICPRQLIDKQAYILNQAMRYAAWSEEQEWCSGNEEGEPDDTFWQDLSSSAKQRKNQIAKVHRLPDECPLCFMRIGLSGRGRFAHWQQNHHEQDLTFCQASWVLNQTTDKETFCQDIPPDYRSPHEKGQGTRYWKWETLMQFQGMKLRSEHVFVEEK
jgi:hypothetical protein